MPRNAGASTSQAGYYYPEMPMQSYGGNDYQYHNPPVQQTQQQVYYDPNNQGYYYPNGTYYGSAYQEMSQRITIRPYRPSDHPHIRALLFEGFVTSKDSFTYVARRRFLLKAPCLLGYLLSASGLGLGLVLTLRTPLLPLPPFLLRVPPRAAIGAGALLFGLGAAMVGAIWTGIPRAIRHFCEKALRSDLAPGRDGIEGVYAAPGVFLVATMPVDGSKEGPEEEKPEEEEIVGYIGLACYTSSEKSASPLVTAEIRRMVVSARLRRRGISTQLMQRVIAHCETLSPIRVSLSTTEFQPMAKRLYEKLGWEVVSERTLKDGIFSARMWTLSREL
ncbi:unnamed protein product [Mycena citricolor]|uniref:N-acetyltransferase domain-containing protein n=1 Tax=Mycena citricolor TaxID=2018698 RepID=A0AAD2Q6D2_9AGAR|nr:unnamed protein product [Mycena citricolor]CAK5278972.1 unnamed protein product [Mycena citricolor]CAK5278982.1 unnamed protein product [Mycena citricolor]